MKFTGRGIAVGAATVAAGAILAGAAAGTASAATPRGGFGPAGYEGVKLGATLKQAKATHKLVIKHNGRCTIAVFKDHRDAAVIISARYGVELINAPASARTPRGIGDGTIFSKVRKAYPNLKYVGDPVDWKIALPGGAFYRLTFGSSNGHSHEAVVKNLQLEANFPHSDCFE